MIFLSPQILRGSFYGNFWKKNWWRKRSEIKVILKDNSLSTTPIPELPDLIKLAHPTSSVSVSHCSHLSACLLAKLKLHSSDQAQLLHNLHRSLISSAQNALCILLCSENSYLPFKIHFKFFGVLFSMLPSQS